jgi:hypothetical protein
MKLSAVVAMSCVAVTTAQKNKNKRPFSFHENRVNAAQGENRAIEGADGNLNLVELHLQTMLSVIGEEWQETPRQMLNYGCYCQLIARRPGVGEPLDALDEACRAYQHCAKCNGMDHGDQTTINGEACNAVSARYELQNNEARDGFECNDEASDGDCGISQCKCDVELAQALFAARDVFDAKKSTENGFEFAEECKAVKPPPGNGGNEFTMACCGEYPARFPFKQTEKRQCCVDKVFTTSKNCCQDGTLSAGSC